MPRTFTFVGIEAQTYDLLMGIGLGLFVIVFLFACRRSGMCMRDAIALACIILLGGFVSARIAAYLIKGEAGQSLYAAGLGAALLGAIYAWKRRISLFAIGNAAAPATALAFGVMKMGCLAAGCCNGTMFLIPVQLWTALLAFGLFIASFAVKRRLAFVLIGYATGRFIIDFLGGDLVQLGPLALNQYVGLAMIAAGIAIATYEHA